MKDYVWVIESWRAQYPTGWESCGATALSRKAAKEELASWKENNPEDKFRLTKYWRLETSEVRG
jgi:hypothetical protein